MELIKEMTTDLNTLLAYRDLYTELAKKKRLTETQLANSAKVCYQLVALLTRGIHEVKE